MVRAQPRRLPISPLGLAVLLVGVAGVLPAQAAPVGSGAAAEVAGSEVRLLPEDALEAALLDLPGWSLAQHQLVTTCRFADFVATVEFVNQLVAPAEALGHHPDLMIAYNRLTIQLTTHDLGGISTADVALAAEISALAGERCEAATP